MNTFFLMSTLILSGGQVILGLAAVGCAIYLGIFATKTYLHQQTLKVGGDIPTSNLVRKHEVVDIKKHETNIKLASFAAALAIVLVVFAWTQFTSDRVIAEFFPEPVAIEMDVPPTPPAPKELPPALPPPAPTPGTEVVIDDTKQEDPKDETPEEPIISNTPSNYTGPTDKNAKSMPFTIEPEPKIEEPIIKEDNIIIDVADQMPRFPGCEDSNADDATKKACADKTMLKYIYDNINYPAIAREMGIEGLAVVSFVVKKDGSIGDLKIVKDPGGGCGKEAARVVNTMNNLGQKWTPGKHRGRTVNVRFNLPVKFKLNG